MRRVYLILRPIAHDRPTRLFYLFLGWYLLFLAVTLPMARGWMATTGHHSLRVDYAAQDANAEKSGQ